MIWTIPYRQSTAAWKKSSNSRRHTRLCFRRSKPSALKYVVVVFFFREMVRNALVVLFYLRKTRNRNTWKFPQFLVNSAVDVMQMWKAISPISHGSNQSIWNLEERTKIAQLKTIQAAWNLDWWKQELLLQLFLKPSPFVLFWFIAKAKARDLVASFAKSSYACRRLGFGTGLATVKGKFKRFITLTLCRKVINPFISFISIKFGSTMLLHYMDTQFRFYLFF